jgi:hypothetical protein
MICKAGDVDRKLVEIISLDARRFFAEMITALVRRDDVKAGRRERLNIVFPRLPVFGKAVQQEQDRAVARARLGEMQRYPVGLNVATANLDHQSLSLF